MRKALIFRQEGLISVYIDNRLVGSSEYDEGGLTADVLAHLGFEVELISFDGFLNDERIVPENLGELMLILEELDEEEAFEDNIDLYMEAEMMEMQEELEEEIFEEEVFEEEVFGDDDW